MNVPIVDVIVPVYNGQAFIREAIASIQQQTFKDIRITVVDDGSVDKTVEIVEEIAIADNRINLIAQDHVGVAFTLNTAIKKSASKYIAFLDADDLWHPKKLEKQLQYLKGGDFEICFCLIQEFQDSSTITAPTKHRARTEAMKGYHKSACLTRREGFDKYGLFNKDIAVGDFVEWFSRVIRGNEPVKMIDEVLAYRRIHNNNTMISADKNSFLHILKAHLDKVRKEGA